MPKKSKELPRRKFHAAHGRLPSAKTWQKARAVMLRNRLDYAAAHDEAPCVDCAQDGYAYWAQQVDGHHIIPRESRPDLVLDPRNVVFVCKRHHAEREALGR